MKPSYPGPPTSPKPRRSAMLASLAVLLGAPAWAQANEASDGGPGTVFENTHLPFEALKAAPDSAFDIVMVSVGVFLLVWLSIAAFLILAKLDSLQQLSQKLVGSMADQAKAHGELAESIRSGIAAAGEPAEMGPEQRALLGELVAATRESGEKVERAVEELGSSMPSEITVDGGSGSADQGAIAAAVASLAEQQRQQAGEMRALVSELRSTGATGSSASDGPDAHGAAPLAERIRLYLASLGYSDIEIVGPRDGGELSLPMDGHVFVEVRRRSTVLKGRVLVEAGGIVHARLQPGYGVFP